MSLSRFGVAMESSLLAQFDQLVEERKSSRSELLRDLARAEIIRSLATQRVDAFASVTIVYNHHVRELSERITEMQHALGDQVRSAMHVHLDHERCLEVIVMRGRADRLQKAAEKLFATRGVIQGSIEIVAETAAAAPAETVHEDEHAKAHAHGHAHTHARPKRRAPRARS
ncbi:MAG TPA: nickel-responsive transcriptional regulator NikR [Polyangiaceae bacterium]|jgi:CopG family nickel-responsive transcriptional regulator